MSKEVATTAGTELAIPDDLLAMMNQSEVKGDDFSLRDLAIPRLYLLQDLSPQVKKQNPKYIEGAEPGMFFNTLDGTLYPSDANLDVFVCGWKLTYNEWVPRNKGGGLQNVFDNVKGRELLATCTKDDKKKMVLPNGNHLVETYEYACVILKDGNPQQVVISMSSSQIKKAKQMNAMIKTVRVPGVEKPQRFIRSYVFNTCTEEKDGNLYSNWDITPGKFIMEFPNSTELFKYCEQTQDGYYSSSLKIDSEDSGEYASSEDDEPAF